MQRQLLALTIVTCSLFLSRGAPAAEPLPPRAEWIPQDAVIVVDIAEPRRLLEPLLDDRVTSAVTASPQYQAATSSAEFKQLAGVVKHYQEKYQVDFRGLVGKLLGGGGRGFICLYVEPEKQAAVRNALKGLNEVQFGFSAEGSRIIFKSDE